MLQTPCPIATPGRLAARGGLSRRGAIVAELLLAELKADVDSVTGGHAAPGQRNHQLQLLRQAQPGAFAERRLGGKDPLVSDASAIVDEGHEISQIGAPTLVRRAAPDHEIVIRDETGATLPERSIGGVFIKGPSIMAGYYGDPEMTAGVLSDDGWLDSGDMGYMVDGALVITGRTKDLIICNGRNIWPQDIEWAVEQLAGVRTGDVAAFSVTGDDGAERVVIVAESRLNDDFSRHQIRRAMAATARITAGVDCEVVLAPPRSLPHTSSGKLSRTAVKENYLTGRYAEAAASRAAVQAKARASDAPLSAAD